MKQFLSLLAGCFIVIAQTPGPRLIVRGDDMGFSHSGNLALIKSFREGIETSIEVIVPSPWFPEAVKLLKENPGVDIGIHLAITSEWELIKWRPVSSCPSLQDSNGYFFPMVFPNMNYPGRSITENNWKIEDVEKEFRAQIELGLKLLPSISHLSYHMGCTSLSKEVKALTQQLAEEYKIPVTPNDEQFLGAGYEGPHKTSEEKRKSFSAMLEKLQPGKTYIFVDHPGIDDNELKAIYHIGYEDVAADRQGVTDVFTDAGIKKLIKQKGIRLITYRDLLQKN